MTPCPGPPWKVQILFFIVVSLSLSSVFATTGVNYYDSSIFTNFLA